MFKHVFSNYTLLYPNMDTGKISVYPLWTVSAFILGFCLMLRNIPLGILAIQFLLMLMTWCMLSHNPEHFRIKNRKRILYIMVTHSMAAFVPVVPFALLYCLKHHRIFLLICAGSAFLISLLQFYLYYTWQKTTPLHDSLEKLHDKTDRSLENESLILKQTEAVEALVDTERHNARQFEMQDAARKRRLGYTKLQMQMLDLYDEDPEHITQEEMAKKLKCSKRTIQRNSDAINAPYLRMGQAKRIDWTRT